MSIRWRQTGELLCAAKTKPEPDDTYIDDRLHYELAVLQRILIPDVDEHLTGLRTWAEPRLP